MKTFNWTGKATIGATTTSKKLTQAEFVMVQQALAIEVELFDALLDAYNKYKRDLKKKKKLVRLKEWKLPTGLVASLSADEHEMMKNMQKMSRRCQVRSVADIVQYQNWYCTVPLLVSSNTRLGVVRYRTYQN